MARRTRTGSRQPWPARAAARALGPGRSLGPRTCSRASAHLRCGRVRGDSRRSAFDEPSRADRTAIAGSVIRYEASALIAYIGCCRMHIGLPNGMPSTLKVPSPSNRPGPDRCDTVREGVPIRRALAVRVERKDPPIPALPPSLVERDGGNPAGADLMGHVRSAPRQAYPAHSVLPLCDGLIRWPCSARAVVRWAASTQQKMRRATSWCEGWSGSRGSCCRRGPRARGV